MQVETTSLVDEINRLETTPSDVVALEEAEHVSRLLADPDVSTRLASYENPSVRGIGGSGIILRATYTPTGSDRALKLPRARLYQASSGDPARDVVVELDPELRALEKLSHQNITRLYEAFALPNGVHHCVITEYVPSSKSLDKYVVGLCCNIECRTSQQRLSSALRDLSHIVYQIADAVWYMHNTAELLHLDLKPENILVTPDGIPFVTDLGFARDISNIAVDTPVEVGFTWRYAHPKLTDPHAGARVSRVAEKAKKAIPANELTPVLDVFAFGRTLQEVLGYLDAEYGEYIHSFYDFVYLHFLACLCLDGRNGFAQSQASSGSFISDFAMQLPRRVFDVGKLATFLGIRTCLERLLGLRRLEDDLPETDPWYGSTIRVSDHGSAVLTPRVASVANHPALRRLKNERQLGMLEAVFPTATHTRYQHTLGTYHAATQYVSALYYDPDNPVFRALFDPTRLEILLLSTLVHDLGHTAYGHELEEVDRKEFDHEEFLADILRVSDVRDLEGRTLREVIAGDGEDSWHVELEALLAFLAGNSAGKGPLDGVLSDIMDSQIDADKFDYLLRDSVEARVTYGHAIDFSRFLRSLTTYPDGANELRLAVKQKGAASAESFALARYQLYQSLYWHHTFRATKAMFLQGVSLILRDLSTQGRRDLIDAHPVRTAYIQNAIGVRNYEVAGYATQRLPSSPRPGARRGDEQPLVSDVIAKRIKDGSGVELPVPFDNDATMRFLWQISSGKSRELLNDLVNRNLYKRVLEISPDQLTMASWQALRDDFSAADERDVLQRNVEEALKAALYSAVQSRSTEVTSMIEDGTLATIQGLARDRVLFIVDIPLRGWFASSESPAYVSDYKRRHFRAESGLRGQEGRTDFWMDTLGTMMKRIAFIRVFCEPQVHGIVTRVMTPETILNSVKEVIPALRQARA
jgi:HD superfamily phosphohydrolase